MISKVSILPVSVEQGQGISILIPSVLTSSKQIGWELAVIETDYTNFAMSSSSIPQLNEDYAQLECPQVGQLEPGLYQLIKLELRDEQANPLQVLLERDFGLCIFEIRNPGTPPVNVEEIVSKYRQIMETRDRDFLKGFGSGSGEYRAFVFVKDLLLTRRMRLGQYEVIPFQGLFVENELEIIQRFLANNDLPVLDAPNDVIERIKKDHPTFVVYFPILKANNKREAAFVSQTECDLLVDLLAIQRNGAGVVFGTVVVDLNSDEIFYHLRSRPYRGNLAGGFIAGEEPQSILTRMNRLRSSDRHQLYVRLFREAIGEPNPELQWFRFWNLLEIIARSKGFTGQPKVDWDGNIILNRKGQARQIQNNAEELVFELIRRTLSVRHISDTSFSNGLSQGALSQQIPIWYRRRNCVVHGGECLCRNPELPLIQDKYINCKAARDEVSTRPDNYFIVLREVVQLVLASELA